MQDPILAQQARSAANSFGVPAGLFTTLIGDESSWNPFAVNPRSGAFGLGQVLPSTASNPGFGIAPISNDASTQDQLDFAAHYLSALHQQTGSWAGAVARYTGNALGVEPYTGSGQTPILGLATAADGGAPPATSGPGFPWPTINGFQGIPADKQPSAQIAAGIQGSALAAWASRIGVILLGIVVIGAGIMLFKPAREAAGRIGRKAAIFGAAA